MDKRIIIIHRSELIRKGLISIIRVSLPNDIIEVSAPEELQDYLNFRDRLIILLVEATASTQELVRYIDRLKEKNTVRSLGITGNGKSHLGPYPFNDLVDTSIPASQLLARIRTLLEDGSEVPSSSPSPSLTEREAEVLKLVALGHLNKEIADKLSISIHTVISHRKNITVKLGIKSISGLTVYAVINRLIDIDQFDPDTII